MPKKLNKKNLFAKDLFTRKYKQKIINPRKGKEALKEKRFDYFKISTLKLITILSSSDKFIPTEWKISWKSNKSPHLA